MTERDGEAEASNWNVLQMMGEVGGQKYFNLQPSEKVGMRCNLGALRIKKIKNK